LSFKEQKHVLSDSSRQALEKAFEQYRRDMADIASFAENINYEIDHNSVLYSIDETEAKYRDQFFELGKFVASSYVNGYINWDWKQKTGEIK
jgi:cytochrome oxidase Cu insertion factor (SCO1/SenC/PrrC family)